MKKLEVVLVVSWLAYASNAAAQQVSTFSLAEVEANLARHKPVPEAVADPEQAVKQALGARRWGMTKSELLVVLKAEIQADFEHRIKVERDLMRQDALYQESEERYRRIQENYVQFNGTKSGWDVSPVAAEFAQNNNESMLVVQNQSSRELYFFMRGKLWKWYREFSADSRGAHLGADTLRTLGAQLGQGKPQEDRLNEAHEPHAGLSWSVSNTRVTALRRGAETCLVFEDKTVLSRLTALRSAAKTKEARAQAANSIDWALLPPAPADPNAK
ncbi:MAG: hypothetical protein ABW321_29470 [Polyangiales bacterium]